MTDSRPTLPPDVIAALEKGQTIEAIKLLRQTNGLGLKEAKDLAEEFLRVAAAAEGNAPMPGPRSTSAPGAAPASVAEALQRGDRIEAIRRLRAETGLQLKDSKEAVDAWIAANPAWMAMAPRRVGQSNVAWLLTLLAAALAAWWLLSSRAC